MVWFLDFFSFLEKISHDWTEFKENSKNKDVSEHQPRTRNFSNEDDQ